MGEKKISILEKLGRIDYRVLYFLSVIMMLIPIIRPLGLPVKVSQPVIDFAKAIDELPEGAVVVWQQAGGGATYDEIRPAMVATLKTLFKHNVKIVAYGIYAEGPIILLDAIKRANPEAYGKKYGIDYVVFGFVAGEESAQASFAADIWKTVHADYYGTPIDQIPLMKDVRNHEDVALIIDVYTSCYGIEWSVRQWYVTHGVPILAITMACCGPMTAPYYPKPVLGYLSGTEGAAELEIIEKIPGEGASISDAKNLGLIPLIIFIILGNIAYIASKVRGEEK